MKRNIKRSAALTMAALLLVTAPAYAEMVSGPGGIVYNTELGPGSISSTPTDSADISAGGPGSNSVTVRKDTKAEAAPGKNTDSTVGTSMENPINITGASVTIEEGGAGTASGTTGQTAAGTGTTEQNAAAAQNDGKVMVSATVPKPEIASVAAALYDVTTKQFLYEKNGAKELAPASTTKLLTALIAVDKLNLTDKVTFSSSATTNLESGASNVQMTKGDTMTVTDCLYAMLLGSACEVSNALAEKISGSQKEFASLMNQYAKELGCTDTKFDNPSGLNSDGHYSTAHDMALITKAALGNATVRKVASTVSYTLPASKKRGKLTLTNGNKMLASSNSEYYKGIIGGKTGYTSKAGNTLATAVEAEGHELVAVVLKSSYKHYTDTKALYDYGIKLIKASAEGTAATAAGNTTSAAGGTNAAAETATTTASTASTASAANGTGTGVTGGTWKSDNGKWQYVKSDGTVAKNEWVDIGENSYFIGSDTYLCVGWKQFSNGSWYYFNPENGAMVKNKWVKQNGKSYYLQSDGTMAKNTVIDGKYKIDAAGVYVGNV